MKQSHLDASEPKELLALIESAKDEADKQIAIKRLANLARDSDTAWKIFLQVCQSPDPSVRLRAAETIGLYWSPDSYDKRAGRLSELVLRLFDDEDSSVRRAVHRSIHYFPESVRGPLYRAAVAVLDQRAQRHGRGEAAALDDADALVELDDIVQRTGDPEVIREVLIPRLVHALRGGEYWTVRCRAAELLYPREGVSGSVDAIVSALTAALFDPDRRVGGSAAYALGQFGPQAVAAVPSLIKAVEDGSPAAALALGHIAPAAKSAVPALLKALHRKRSVDRSAWSEFVSPDLDPVRNAAIALVMLDAHLGAQLDLITRVLLLHLSIHAEQTDYDDPEEERLAADALARFGVECQAAVPALLEGLRAEWPPVRKYAAATLIRIHPPAEQVVPALRRILREEAKEHNDGYYTYYIRWALDQITRQQRER